MKMALQISIVETAANQENRCSALQASVYSAKSPTTFVDGVSSGKSRLNAGSVKRYPVVGRCSRGRFGGRNAGA